MARCNFLEYRFFISIPQKILRYFEFFITITANGTENFKPPLNLRGKTYSSEIWSTYGGYEAPLIKTFIAKSKFPQIQKG